MNQTPDNLIDFLYWVKEQTELFWSIDPKTSKNEFVCDDWIFGAKWVGLSEKQIDDTEIKYSISFTPEHREFLKILHTIDRKEIIEYTDTFDEGAEILIEEKPFFYNWLTDDVELKERFDWPFDTIYKDVIGSNSVWLKSWGTRPSTDEGIKKIYSNWFEKTQKLIPLTSHRFLVSDLSLVHRPVLSIWGSDIIVYGWNLRNYLLRELQDHLNIKKLVYDEEDACYYSELIEEVKSILNEENTFDEKRDVPYLKEMILIWSSGWSSFGLKYPRKDDSIIQPIVKTYSPENETPQQKSFKAF